MNIHLHTENIIDKVETSYTIVRSYVTSARLVAADATVHQSMMTGHVT